ncbi:MAG: RNA methyltransferase [Desulfatibacillum sp.]|nr:RNA methyltransferase [Desulfatibacillum sp.]
MALMHYPVTDKNGEVICSAVTNLDLHDMARAARTYGVSRFYVVTPLEDQKILAQRIVDHWVTGPGSKYNPKRKQAISLVMITDNLEQAIREIEQETGEAPEIVVTDARPQAKSMDYAGYRAHMDKGKPCILVFGTAWGMTKEFIETADIVLDPIIGPTDYNHLSVRSAASIILDRLLGR